MSARVSNADFENWWNDVGTFYDSEGTAFTRDQMFQAYCELLPDDDDQPLYKSQAEQDAYYAAVRAVVPETPDPPPKAKVDEDNPQW